MSFMRGDAVKTTEQEQAARQADREMWAHRAVAAEAHEAQARWTRAHTEAEARQKAAWLAGGIGINTAAGQAALDDANRAHGLGCAQSGGQLGAGAQQPIYAPIGPSWNVRTAEHLERKAGQLRADAAALQTAAALLRTLP